MSEPSLMILTRRGRRPRAEAASRVKHIRLSPEEEENAKKAAEINNQPLSTFIREAIVTASGDCLESKRN